MNHVEFRDRPRECHQGQKRQQGALQHRLGQRQAVAARISRAGPRTTTTTSDHSRIISAYIYARMPDRYMDAKDFLLANMYEEEIGGDRHTDLLIRFAEACGTTAERVKDPDNMTATTRGLQSWCYAIAMREDPIVAVAGLVVGLESQVPSIYRKQTPTLREKYKFTDEEIEFFDLHIVSDEIHGERGYQIVLEHADTVELQQRCLKICEVGAQMRLLYTTALYQDYVAKDIPLSELDRPKVRSRATNANFAGLNGADGRFASRRPSLPRRGQGKHQPRCEGGHQAIPVSPPSLRLRNGQVCQVRLPHHQGR